MLGTLFVAAGLRRPFEFFFAHFEIGIANLVRGHFLQGRVYLADGNSNGFHREQFVPTAHDVAIVFNGLIVGPRGVEVLAVLKAGLHLLGRGHKASRGRGESQQG